MRKLISVSGWLSPTGEFYECLYTEHWDKAKEICHRQNIKILVKGFFNKDPEMTLEKNGWVKLSQGTVQYYLEDGKRISKKQLDFIFDYLTENGRNIARYEQILSCINSSSQFL
ncbi:MAG: hypothetical protein VR69_04040 [Peptococcaceae bacterium BRH_c4b]|nr:MAG: hypothetical protein VR69_04040 [Peptococcaceae bacterium BRH_c4b]